MCKPCYSWKNNDSTRGSNNSSSNSDTSSRRVVDGAAALVVKEGGPLNGRRDLHSAEMLQVAAYHLGADPHASQQSLQHQQHHRMVVAAEVRVMVMAMVMRMRWR